MSNTIYLVLLNWSTDDDDGIETFLFAEHEAAYKKYLDLIAIAKDPNASPLGKVFDKNDDPIKGYDLSFHECERDDAELYWHLVEQCDYNRHYFVDLKRTGLQ